MKHAPAVAKKQSPSLIPFSDVTLLRKFWEYWTECPVVFQPEPFDITDTALMILANGTSQDLEIFFGTAWSIQYNRNLAVFESTCQLPAKIWNFARRYLQDF